MVPAQGVGFHEYQREDGEDRKRYDFLNHLQFPDRERASEFGAADTVCLLYTSIVHYFTIVIK